MLANGIADAPDGTGAEPEPALRPDGQLEAPTPSATSCRSASTCRSVTSCSFINEIDEQIPRDFAPGHEAGLATVSGHRIADGHLLRERVRLPDPSAREGGCAGDRRLDQQPLLPASANSAQHVAIGQMRAAETGRPVIQAAISGISALIDAHGRVHAAHAAVRPHQRHAAR